MRAAALLLAAGVNLRAGAVEPAQDGRVGAHASLIVVAQAAAQPKKITTSQLTLTGIRATAALRARPKMITTGQITLTGVGASSVRLISSSKVTTPQLTMTGRR